MSKILDDFGQKVTAIGVIATAIVGLNSALTSCSTQTVNRYAGFRAAVTSEENFWKDRLTEYSTIMDLTDERERRRKLWALAALAQHDIPDFQEYRFGLFDDRQAIKAARARLQGMRDTLNQALQNDEASDAEVAAAVKQSVAFDQAQKDIPNARAAPRAVTTPSPNPTPTSQPTTPASVNLSYASQVLSRGKANGWDIDLFWCAGGGTASDQVNYALARDLAMKLAAIGAADGQLGASVPLGQVRLAPLPSLKQGGTYPVLGSGNTVRVDANDAEQKAASALVKQFGDAKPKFTLVPNSGASQWYLSAFVCNVASPI